MKLAEALQERADLNVKIEQLRSRLENNAQVEEGEQPAEIPDDLLTELNACIDRLTWLIGHINLTNCRTVIDGKTLTEMIAGKDTLVMKLSVYRKLADAASKTVSRARHSEIRILPTVRAAEMQKQIDGMAKELRLLDNSLQQANWTTDLIE